MPRASRRTDRPDDQREDRRDRGWIDDPDKRAQVESHITGQTLYVDGGLTLYPSFREPWSSE